MPYEQNDKYFALSSALFKCHWKGIWSFDVIEVWFSRHKSSNNGKHKLESFWFKISNKKFKSLKNECFKNKFDIWSTKQSLLHQNSRLENAFHVWIEENKNNKKLSLPPSFFCKQKMKSNYNVFRQHRHHHFIPCFQFYCTYVLFLSVLLHKLLQKSPMFLYNEKWGFMS